jgi:hypothetical protein
VTFDILYSILLNNYLDILYKTNVIHFGADGIFVVENAAFYILLINFSCAFAASNCLTDFCCWHFSFCLFVNLTMYIECLFFCLSVQ